MYFQMNAHLGQAQKASVPSPSPVASLVQRVRDALRRGQEKLAITLAISHGFREANQITNLVFWARHPRRWGQKLQPTDPEFSKLSREWTSIRDQLVRPNLMRLDTNSTKAATQVKRAAICVHAGPCTACERRIPAGPAPQLVDVPAGFLYHKGDSERLEPHTLVAYASMLTAARADGIPNPYLNLISGHRTYDKQASLWKSRLLSRFEKLGCPTSSLSYIGSAIDKTTATLKPLPVPHPKGAWATAFVTQLRQDGGDPGCDPVRVVSDLRKGTAPPGSSPHHTGRAIDIHVGGRIARAEANVAYQRRQPAYEWLVCNAKRFGFYPYSVEPWHWEHNPPD
jgi:hypothetical protein